MIQSQARNRIDFFVYQSKGEGAKIVIRGRVKVEPQIIKKIPILDFRAHARGKHFFIQQAL